MFQIGDPPPELNSIARTACRRTWRRCSRRRPASRRGPTSASADPQGISKGGLHRHGHLHSSRHTRTTSWSLAPCWCAPTTASPASTTWRCPQGRTSRRPSTSARTTGRRAEHRGRSRTGRRCSALGPASAARQAHGNDDTKTEANRSARIPGIQENGDLKKATTLGQVVAG